MKVAFQEKIHIIEYKPESRKEIPALWLARRHSASGRCFR
ncbi:hypothetical protein CLOM621_08773 [Clostridium sp. M62/1]|nr:hypothetical protein CLOM621_08773 [Clostridium sp. M62/1]